AMEMQEKASVSRPKSGTSRKSMVGMAASSNPIVDVTSVPFIRQVRPLSRAGRGNSAYDRELFSNIVTGDIEEYFEYLEIFEPEPIDFEPRLCPFVPDYIPSIGSVDPIIKVTKPYGGKEELGILILDEPCLPQSDPAILALQLRSLSQHLNDTNMVVKHVNDIDKESNIINTWIKEVTDLHKANPVPTFRLPESMPSIESLLEPFSPEDTVLLKEEGIPFSLDDCTTEQLFKNICGRYFSDKGDKT
ncbi:hypothetical protein QYM36_015296, partial [Artemia franciscana]